MDTTKELLGRRIKELRKSRGISQDQLAERVDIDPKHLSRIEVGRGYPSLDTLEGIAHALDVEVKDFFEFTHLREDASLVEEITGMLKEASEEKLRLILKVVRAIAR